MSTMRPPTMAQAHQLMLSHIRARVSGDASLRASARVPLRFGLHLNRICGSRVTGWRAGAAASAPSWKAEGEVHGMTELLDSLKWNSDGLVAVIVQHVDTGELLMQAFADRNAICETLQTGLATFYSRSRQERWCKGETSGNFITVFNVHADCDRDSIIYLSSPAGPSCHTGARTCWFSDIAVVDNQVVELGEHKSDERVPRTSLYALEKTIADRRGSMANPEERPSWTAKLLHDPELLCKKVREEADELCRTWEQKEGRERTASEMADLLYHAMVLLNVQESLPKRGGVRMEAVAAALLRHSGTGVEVEEVLAVLRGRFGTSGIDEKASRSS